MIPLTLQPEPAGFDANVRQPGLRFIAGVPRPTNKQFGGNAFWRWASNELYAAYKGICAYTCFYLMSPGTIDHFLPKSTRPELAYEWRNLRLASHRVNTYKGNNVGIVDPVDVQRGWFVLDVPSCLIFPGDGLPVPLAEQIQNTIDVLRLNSDDKFVQERCDLMYNFASGDVSLDFLKRRFPFLAAEIERQNIVDTAKTIFKARPPTP